MNKKIQGKKNRESGARFERRVRADLEKKGWIVDRWNNNVEFRETELGDTIDNCERMFDGSIVHNIGETDVVHGKLIPAKYTPRNRWTGFPDFIGINTHGGNDVVHDFGIEIPGDFVVIGIEVKQTGKLDKEEKEKIKWYLDNNIFSKILIASKGKKRGEIKYLEWK
jgi:hypothetical protein